MKKILFTGLFLTVFFASTLTLTAAVPTKDVAVLYHDTTETNRQTMNFMKKNFASDGSGWVLHFIANPGEIKPGQYKAVIVLSTGLTSGTDPYFAAFLKSYPVKKEVILVSLVKDSKELVVTHVPSDGKNSGVDALTAASVWSRSSSGTNPQFANGIEMHLAWVKEILQILKGL